MSISINLLVIHWIADFILQSNWMAQGKSRNTWVGIGALTIHAAVYSLCFIWWGILFAGITFVTHWVTDLVTSRITRRLFPFVKAWPLYPDSIEWLNLDGKSGRSNHWFFVCIGFDQLIHFTTLALTYQWLFS